MPANDSHFDWSVSDSQADDLYRGKVPVVVPKFNTGDMVSFDNWLLHRTRRNPGMKTTRYAIESRFLAPSVFPVGRRAMIA